jgi:hypothetical protein
MLLLIHALCSSLEYALSPLSLLSSQSLPGSDFQWRTLSLLCVTELFPRFSSQFLTATAHNDWTDCSPTNSLHSTLLNSAALTNSIQLGRSSHIASERIRRERHLQHVFYCCATSPRTWRVPLLRLCGPLSTNGSTCYNIISLLQALGFIMLACQHLSIPFDNLKYDDRFSWNLVHTSCS